MEHITNVIDQIRLPGVRALDTCIGQAGLNELDDWVQAEHELLACQRCEVREEANHFVTEVDAAEFEPKDLKVSLLRNDLMIEGTSRTEKKVGGTGNRKLTVVPLWCEHFCQTRSIRPL